MNEESLKWYVSGFVDGEGYFIARPVYRKTGKGYPRVSFGLTFGIQVRADDRPALEIIRKVISGDTDSGTINERKRKGDSSSNVTLQYDGVKHNKVVKEHFTNYPLLAKKKRDFDLWKDVYDSLTDPDFSKYNGNRKKSGELSHANNYTMEQIENRIYISHLCDLIRIGRIHKDMRDLGRKELLRRFGGQENLYSHRTTNYFRENGALTSKQSVNLLMKYSLKI